MARSRSRVRHRGGGRGEKGGEEGERNPNQDKESIAAPEAASALSIPVLRNRGKMRSFWVRFWTSWAMVLATFCLTYFGRQPGVAAMIFIMQGLIYREVVLVSIRYDEDKKLPSFKFFYYYWFLVCAFYFYCRSFRFVLPRDLPWWLLWVVDKHAVLAFGAYMLGFVWFVLSLEREHYSYQLARFAFCHVALVGVVVSSVYLAFNSVHGMLWFVLPSGMVVCNDVFAYIFGFFFGRTPLIQLSPKKTWEGFVGGGIVTLIWAFFWCGLMERLTWWSWNQVMLCPMAADEKGEPFFEFPPSCDITKVNGGAHVAQPLTNFVVGKALATVLPHSLVASVSASETQLHAVVMAAFASLVAPFGGFYASALKRSMRISDWAKLIPGHGGFTDRMDCQLVHGAFAYIYLTHIFPMDPLPVFGQKTIMEARDMSQDQQKYLFCTLAEQLNYQNITQCAP